MKFIVGDRVICQEEKRARVPRIAGEGPGTVIEATYGVVRVKHDNGYIGSWEQPPTGWLTYYTEEPPKQVRAKPASNGSTNSPYMSGSIYSKGPDGETMGPSGNKWL